MSCDAEPMVKLKDPDALLNYAFDWSDWLEEGDTLADSAVTITPDGLTTSLESRTTTRHRLTLSGGVDGTRYAITCRVVTSNGLQDDRTGYIQCQQR